MFNCIEFNSVKVSKMGCLMLKELVKSRVFSITTIVAGSVFLASCSSGVSRFDMPMFGLSGSDGSGATTASLPDDTRFGRDEEGSSRYSDGGALADFQDDRNSGRAGDGTASYNTRNSYLPPQTAAPEVRSARYKVDDRSSLAEFENRNVPTAGNVQPMKPIREARRSFLPSEPARYDYNVKDRQRPAARRTVREMPSGSRPVRSVQPLEAASGSPERAAQQIVVGPGDTLYSIGRRYKTSVVKLMDLNQLSDSNLTVGQRLIVPASGAAAPRPSGVAQKKPVMQATSSGTYTIRPGENFRAIAAKLNVSASQLADINGITDPDSIRAGEVLILPSGSQTTARRVARKKPASRNHGKGQTQKLSVRTVKTKTISLAPKKVRLTEVSKREKGVVAKSTRKKAAIETAFRWPVQGRIIEKFGPRRDGTHNDGINLAVPSGTTVKAAEAGVVAYAGNELEGYGNLVLIRHADDWVSAYAHNDKLMVKRGDKIKRGQVVARAGTSGSVEQPQVHFELRKGSKPVDPLKYMAGT